MSRQRELPDGQAAPGRVFITGGTGFIGRHVTRRALARGWDVALLVRRADSPRAQRMAAEGARLILGDVTDRNAFRTALEVASPDLLLHIAGWYELGIPRRARRRMWAVNVEATEIVLSLAAEAGVRRTVYTSSTVALGDTGGSTADESFARRAQPLSYYERTKTEGHAIAVRHQSAGEPVVIVCPAQVIGPEDHSAFGIMARLYARRRLPPLGWAPESIFTFAHVEDVAEAMLRAAEHGLDGETYFVAGTQLTNRQMAAVWGESCGRSRRFVWLPRTLAMLQASLAAPLLRLAGQPAFLSPEVVRSSFVTFAYSSERATQDLGAAFRPAEQAWREALQEAAGPGRS